MKNHTSILWSVIVMMLILTIHTHVLASKDHCITAEPPPLVAVTIQQNKPLAGDILERRVIEGIDIGEEGENILWDFSKCTILEDRATMRFSLDSLGIRSIAPGLKTYYCQKGDTLMIHKFRTQQEYIEYDKPMIVMIDSISYGYSISSDFSGRGKYGETYNLSHSGTRIIKADAQGDIILPDNLFLANALRVHTVTFMNILLEGMDANLADTATAKQVLTEDYKWYVKGYRYPLIEYTTDTSFSDGVQVASKSKALCFLPDSIFNDSVIIEDLEQTANNDSIGKGPTNKLPIEYSLSQSGNSIHISYVTNAKASVSFVVASVTGVLMEIRNYNTKADEQNDLTFNCNGYRPGEYILYINVNGNVISEKIHIKQR